MGRWNKGSRGSRGLLEPIDPRIFSDNPARHHVRAGFLRGGLFLVFLVRM